MNPRYRISKKALEDIENIWLYTYENWSIEQADKYYNLIISEIEYISDNYHLTRKIDFIKDGYRVSKVKSHFIFFSKAIDGYIEIVRILHEKMDIDYQLKQNNSNLI